MTPMETYGNGARMTGMTIMKALRSMAAFGMPLMIPDLKSLAAVLGSALRSTVGRRFATPMHPATAATQSVFASSSPSGEVRNEKKE